MKFNYQARTQVGKLRTGLIESSSKEAAAELLKSKGLYVTALEEAIVPIYAHEIKLFDRVSRKDVVVLSRQLAIMFKSKIQVVETFETLARQTKSKSLREKVLKISEKIEGGTPLSTALALYPKIFSPFYISMVKSGEASGKLSDIFMYLADYMEREHDFSEKVKGAMIYPAFILVVFFAVIWIVVSFVIPQLADFLKETGQQLPWITVMFINTSEFLRTKGWFLLIIVALIAIAIWQFTRTKQGKRTIDALVLKIPAIGSFFKKVYLTRIAMTLSTLVSGGLPIVQALDITAEVAGNALYKNIMAETREGVKKGEQISATLSRYPDSVPPLFYQMVSVGEKTGTLDATLGNLVDFYQKEVDRAMDALLKFLEPMIIIVLGVLVGLFAFAVLVPLYSFGNL